MRRMMCTIWTAACAAVCGAAEPAAPATRPAWTWQRMAEPKGLPLLGNESAAAFDTDTRKMLLFGGHLGNGGPQLFYTWWYDPERNTWEHARPANRPPGSCCVRDGVYDEANRRTYYLGGHAYNHGWQWRAPNIHGGGTPWAYDAEANTWTAMKPLVSRRATPWTAGAYDRDHQVVVTYGGEGFYDSDVWVYDGYSNTWTRLARKGEGPDYGGHVPPMAYDAEHRVTLLYGCGQGARRRDELWTYDLATNTWTARNDAQRPARAGMPLMVYDPRNRLPVLFVPAAKEPLKAFAYEWDRNTWRELPVAGDPPPSHTILVGAYDPVGGRTILGKGLVYSGEVSAGYRRPDATYVLRHPRPAAASARLPAPSDPKVTAQSDAATLTWQPVPGAAGYVVYRGTGPTPWQVIFAKVAEAEEPTFADRGLAPKAIHFYFVRAVDAKGVEGAASLKVRTQPRAPAEPVVSVLAADRVEIDWRRSADPDVAGYNLYRGAGAAVTKLNEALLTETAYTDRVTVPGTGDAPMRYVVRAVNRLGVESGPSPWAATIPAEPTRIVARTEDGRPIVTWSPSPQKGLRGYAVYRADSGAGDARTIAKRIAGPVTGARFEDASKAGPGACKYYVVAIDAIGQEGYASHGAWLDDPDRS